MPIIDCSCRGINPDCNKCDGKGYYDSDAQNRGILIHCVPKLKMPVKTSLIPHTQTIKLSSIKEIQIIIKEIIKKIDSLSVGQTNILKQISFKHSSISYINLRINKIKALQMEKDALKEKLTCALERAKDLNIPISLNYRHYFSIIDINAFDIKDFILLKEKLIKLDMSKNISAFL